MVFLQQASGRRQAYAEKLTRLGIPTSLDEVINPSLVLARYLANSEHGMAGATVFAIGEPPLLEELTAAGGRIVEPGVRVCLWPL